MYQRFPGPIITKTLWTINYKLVNYQQSGSFFYALKMYNIHLIQLYIF